MSALLTHPTPKPSRDPLDRCYTPSWCTRLLLERWPADEMGGVWEPCAGHGHIARVLDAAGAGVYGSDVDPGSPYDQLDFLEREPGTLHGPVDSIVSNPPYNIRRGDGRVTAADFVRHALTWTPNVAMLLRLSWLEPCQERELIFKDTPPDRMWILPRVHYEGPGGGDTNNQTSIWFVWREDLEGPCQTDWWFEADKARAIGQQKLFGTEA